MTNDLPKKEINASIDIDVGTANDRTQVTGASIGNANSTVNISIPRTEELPPEIQNATLKQMIVATINSLQNIEERSYYQFKEIKEEFAMRTRFTARFALITYSLLIIILIALAVLEMQVQTLYRLFFN